MYDPKFEKEVQRKMEELEFSPSEAVWTNIEREVTRERKRRRVPFFWLWLAPALLLSGAAIGYLAFRPFSPVTAKTRIQRPEVAPVVSGDRAVTPARKAAMPAAPLRAMPATSLAETAEGIRPPIIRGKTTLPVGATAHTGESNARGTDHLLADRSAAGHSTVDQSSVAGQAPGVPKDTRGRTAVPGKEDVVAVEERTLSGAEEAELASEGSVSISAREHKSYTPGLGRLLLSPPRISAAGLVVTGLGVSKIPTPLRPWEAGFTGGFGFSSLKQPFSSGAPAASNVFYSFNPSGPAPSAAPQKNYVSDVQPALAFSAGILARKPLSGRWAVTVGLSLQYYSARIHIGEQVNGFTAQTASLINSAAAAPIQTYPYYSTGNDQVFTNRYYFLTIPGSIQWQINHSRVLPLWWEGGASLSYLVSSEALYYNPQSGVYFKDAGVINRTQLNLSTSLMAGLPLGSVRLQVGPQVQYGVTSLLKAQGTGTGGQHLIYGGIRVVVIPSRRK